MSPSRSRSSLAARPGLLPLLLAAALASPRAGLAAEPEAPRLVVVVSVDQLRPENFDSAPGGFRALRDGGAVFAEARQDHVPTETGPGHAAILTGRYPARHGIIGNEWWDPALGRMAYVVEDSVHGLGPERLAAYALGDVLKAKDPRSKVVSLSGKDRAAILMGGKKPDLAVWYDRKAGEYATSSYYRRPDWLDGYNRRLRDEGGPLHGLAGKAASEFSYSPAADRALLGLVREALRRERLGRDAHPDILAVSFSATDYVGHRFGPHSAQMREQLRGLASVLEDLLEELEAAAGRGRFALVLTADHGVAPLVESPEGKALGARRALWEPFHDALEAALQAWKPAREPWLTGRSYPNLFLNRPQARRMGLEWSAFLREACRVLERVPELANAQPSAELEENDPYREVFERSVFPGRSGDIVLRVKPGVIVTSEEGGTDHAAPYDYDARVPLVFYGPAFKPGRVEGPARVVDIAPTLAVLLGLEFRPEKGARAWRELLAR